jgi:methyl-accepting chemotaxis protein
VAQTGKALERIEAKVSEINGVVADIAASAQEQAAGLQQINAAVSQMDQATQQNAAMSEQARASGQSLAQECDRLTQLIGQFQVGKGADDPIRRELERVAPHAFPERAKPPSAGRSFGAVAATPPRAKRPVVAKALADAPVRRAAEAEDADEGWKEF